MTPSPYRRTACLVIANCPNRLFLSDLPHYQPYLGIPVIPPPINKEALSKSIFTQSETPRSPTISEIRPSDSIRALPTHPPHPPPHTPPPKTHPPPPQPPPPPHAYHYFPPSG